MSAARPLSAEPAPLIVAVSSRALFDLDHSHALYESEGLEAYQAFQREREDEPLSPGVAYPLVRKLLALNERLESGAPGVEVILISRNSCDTGLRIFNSIEALDLPIVRAAFTNGAAPYPTSSRSTPSCSYPPTARTSPTRCVPGWRRRPSGPRATRGSTPSRSAWPSTATRCSSTTPTGRAPAAPSAASSRPCTTCSRPSRWASPTARSAPPSSPSAPRRRTAR